MKQKKENAQERRPQPHVYLGCPGNSRADKASKVSLKAAMPREWMKQKGGVSCRETLYVCECVFDWGLCVCVYPSSLVEQKNDDDQISYVMFPPVCTVTSTTDFLSCCSPSVLRLMTECELRRGTALSLSLPLQWTQSQSSTATPRRKVCLCHCMPLFFSISFSIFPPDTHKFSLRPRQTFSFKVLVVSE